MGHHRYFKTEFDEKPRGSWDLRWATWHCLGTEGGMAWHGRACSIIQQGTKTDRSETTYFTFSITDNATGEVASLPLLLAMCQNYLPQATTLSAESEDEAAQWLQVLRAGATAGPASPSSTTSQRMPLRKPKVATEDAEEITKAQSRSDRHQQVFFAVLTSGVAIWGLGLDLYTFLMTVLLCGGFYMQFKLIQFAPFSTPLPRRKQTLAILLVFPPLLMVYCTTAYLLLLYHGGLVLRTLCLAYAAFIYLDRAPASGSWTSSAIVPVMRRLALWKHAAEYFPVRLVKTAELPADKNYVFGCCAHHAETLAHCLLMLQIPSSWPDITGGSAGVWY